MFSKNQTFVLLISPVGFLFSVSLISTLIFIISFLLLALGLVYSFIFFLLLSEVDDQSIYVKSLFPLNTVTHSYKFPSKHCFTYIPYNFLQYVSIFIHLKVFSNFLFDFFSDSLVV